MLLIIRKLVSSETSQIMSTRVSTHVYSRRLTIMFNNCIKYRKFPDILKYANIASVFQKRDTADKSNYRPISTLKFYKNVWETYSHVDSYTEPKLSRYLAGFRQNHDSQQAYLRMIQSWRALQSKGQKVGAIMADLS